MFNKEENLKIKKIKLDNKNLYKQYNNISITPAFFIMLNKYYEDKKMQDHLDLDERIKLYLDKSFEYSIKKQYDDIIDNLYHSGKIIINKKDFNLKDFYIVFKNNQQFYLRCTDDKYQNENIDYNKAVKLIDTTAFIELITKNEVKNNSIIVSNNDLLDIINNWDGLLHDKVHETDAINNKQMIGSVIDE